MPAAAELQSDAVLPEAVQLDSLPDGRVSKASSCEKYSTRVPSSLSRETSSGRFIPEMDGLRFVAIAMVVLYHLNGYLRTKTTFYEHGPTMQRDWFCAAALVGFHGVELFFVISGFILALPFARTTWMARPP